MSEHELTEEKIGELWDAGEHTYIFFDDLGLHSKNLFSSFARAAYDLGKAARDDDGLTDCEYGDVREGDPVERTFRYAHGTVVTTVGVASRLDQYDCWRDSGGILLASDDAGATYRRKPAKATPPDPEKHPVILDEDGEAHWFDEGYYHRMRDWFPSNPEDFGNDWTPAKIVADTEED